jgi:hypothetical protein
MPSSRRRSSTSCSWRSGASSPGANAAWTVSPATSAIKRRRLRLGVAAGIQALLTDREVVVELKWILAIACETAFWVLFLAFLLLRYRYGRDGASVAVLVAIVADHIALLGLAAWDYLDTGHVNVYMLAILGLLVYALTLGKRDMKRVDSWAKRRFSRREPGRRAARSVQPHRP